MATYQDIQYFANGYVVENVELNKTACESWLLLPAENLWPSALRGFLYILALFYLFLGIAIASDIFMSAIEMITSKKRTVVTWDEENQEKVEREVMLWNETVANLTLMALGSSAPEILLATIETGMRLGTTTLEKEDSLGTFTIIGSAAFNLLIITAVCVVSVDVPNVKLIREFGVFLVTAVWSLWAYVWMLLVVSYITPGVVDWWEAWLTLGFMPLFVLNAYAQDSGWWCKKCCKQKVQGVSAAEEMEEDEANVRIVTHRPRAGSFTGHMIPGKELHILEAEKAHRMSQAQHTQQEAKTSESLSTEKIVKVRKSANEPQVFARARFRHAVVSAMTGTKSRPVAHRHPPIKMSSVVEKVKMLNEAARQGKKPEGDLLGKFTFASDRYAVLESAGILEVDILFHRNIVTKEMTLSHSSDNVVFKNGRATFAPVVSTAVNLDDAETTFTGAVSVIYETREGSAKAGKDYRFSQGELTFGENEFRKTVPIAIINDNQFENDVEFYIILKSPTGGSSLGEPSIARVTIVDDDEPGEFLFEESRAHADMAEGMVTCRVIREHGFDGKVRLEYSTIDGTAVGGDHIEKGVDYVQKSGIVSFEHSETSKTISVQIDKTAKGSKNFIISLRNPSLGAKIGSRSAVVCHINKDDLGDRIAEVIEDEAEEDTSWRGQFVNAMTVGGNVDDDGNEVPAKCTDYLLHFLTFFWKLIGACVPPTQYLGAWPTFVFSLVYIAGLTACVEQLGHLLGCVIGLKTSVTGITIIALGTSLPDTFASRTAAKQDEHADAAIGNVTGSNSVNVFLGLGLPWVMGTMYSYAKGTKYRVASGNLTPSVIIFGTCGLICIILLIVRRKFVGGELGGKNAVVRWLTCAFMLSLWLIYVILSSLRAYDVIIW